MRPRVFPAKTQGQHGARVAPRRFNEAAGIPRGRPVLAAPYVRRDRCFNEAAGIPRGRLPCRAARPASRSPSMRPRVFPAEDTRAGRAPLPMRFSFNEAAGIPRGRLLGWVETAVAWIPLQ